MPEGGAGSRTSGKLAPSMKLWAATVDVFEQEVSRVPAGHGVRDWQTREVSSRSHDSAVKNGDRARLSRSQAHRIAWSQLEWIPFELHRDAVRPVRRRGQRCADDEPAQLLQRVVQVIGFGAAGNHDGRPGAHWCERHAVQCDKTVRGSVTDFPRGQDQHAVHGMEDGRWITSKACSSSTRRVQRASR